MIDRIKTKAKKTSPRLYNYMLNFKHMLYVRSEMRRNSTLSKRIERLREAHQNVDPYQPLYGVDGFKDGQRSTKERCETIYKDIFSEDVKGLRILDVGCYFGYLTFYLSERGANVEGWDIREENIEVCNRLKDVNGIHAEFSLNDFGPETIKRIPPNKYDAVIILSVLHWTIHEKGLDYVQNCMKLIFDKTDTVIVELAQKGEDKTLYWDKAVPKNDVAIFDKVKNLSIKEISKFSTHLSGKQRPLYLVTKKKL